MSAAKDASIYVSPNYLAWLLRVCLVRRIRLGIEVFGISLITCLLVKPVAADTTAQRLLVRLEAKLRNSRSMAGTVDTVGEDGAQMQLHFKALKPNLYAIISKTRELHCDGNAVYDYSPQNQLYTRQPLKPTLSPDFTLLEPFQPFVVPMPSRSTRVNRFRRERFDGKVCNVISMMTPDNKAQETIYLDSRTDLPCGYRRVETDLKGRQIATLRTYHNVRLNVPADPEEFTWESPQGASFWIPTRLKVGNAAPLFTLKTSDGAEVELADVLHHSRAVILNFWFCGCGPCRREFTYLEKLYRDLKSQGLAVLTINILDPPQKISKYFADEQLSFEALVDQKGDNSVQTKYSVVGTPYTFVIGPDRTIIDNIYDINDPGLAEIRKALSKLGISDLANKH